MTDIFDEIIQCLRQEQAADGTLFIRKENLTEFFQDFPSAAPRQEQPIHPQTADRNLSVPQQRTDSRPRPPAADRTSFTARTPAPKPDFNRGETEENTPMERAYSPLDLAEIASMNWDQLKSATALCRACRLCEGRHHVVFADGSEQADLMFIGEGPGADEDAQGVPFVGKAGQLLTKMIAAMQFRRSEVYIANIVKCRPPGNRNPEEDEMESCLPYLNRQIQLVSPKVIVLLGNVALKGLMKRGGISRLRGQWLDYKGIKVMPTFHPAYLLRYEAAKRDAWSDLQQVMKVFGKVYPRRNHGGASHAG